MERGPCSIVYRLLKLVKLELHSGVAGEGGWAPFWSASKWTLCSIFCFYLTRWCGCTPGSRAAGPRLLAPPPHLNTAQTEGLVSPTTRPPLSSQVQVFLTTKKLKLGVLHHTLYTLIGDCDSKQSCGAATMLGGSGSNPIGSAPAPAPDKKGRLQLRTQKFVILSCKKVK